MFKELYPLAQSSPIVMLVSAEGESLRINITQKAAKNGKPISVSVLASPDELDDELPDAIAEASGQTGDRRAVAEQVREQFGGAKPAAPAPKPAPATTSTTTPQAKAGAAPAPNSKAAKKQECIDDYIRLATNPKTRAKLNREYFIKQAKSSRNFERLFGGWTAFKKAAEKALAASSKADETAASAADAGTPQDTDGAPPVDDRTLNLPLEQEGAEAQEISESDAEESTTAPASEAPQPAPVAVTSVPDSWPFATPPVDIVKNEPTDDVSQGWDVYDEQGHYLSSVQGTPPVVGRVIRLLDHGDVEATQVDGRRVITKPAAREWMVRVVGSGRFLFNARETRKLAPGEALDHQGVDYLIAELDQAHLQCWVRRKLRKLISDAGEDLGASELDVEPGSPIALEGIDHTVMRADGEQIVVRAPEPPKVRKVVDEEANAIGTHTGEVDVGNLLSISDVTYSVLRANDKVIFVERSTVTEGA